MVWQLLDSAVINANVVRKAKKEELGIKGFGNREFLEELAEDLYFEAKQQKAEDAMAEMQVKGTLDRLILGYFAHFPCVFEKKGVCLVCRDDGKVKQKLHVLWGCEQCELHMHLECFKAYHTQQHPRSGKFD